MLLDNVLFLSVFNALITTSQSFIECRRSALFNTSPSYIVNNGDLIFSFSRDLVKTLTLFLSFKAVFKILLPTLPVATNKHIYNINSFLIFYFNFCFLSIYLYYIIFYFVIFI